MLFCNMKKCHVSHGGGYRTFLSTVTSKISIKGVTYYLNGHLSWYNFYTLKLMYNDHLWDLKIVVFVDRWSLFRGHLSSKSPTRTSQKMVIIDMWSLFQTET